MDVRSYKDLKVWQKAMQLVTAVYPATQDFPKTEMYGLTNQIRRCAVSVPSNIAEGSARRTTREFIRFVNIASGSIAELETQLILAQRLGYLAEDRMAFLLKQSDEIGKMLYALQRALTERLIHPEDSDDSLDSKL